jgi:Meiotically up-regulated gene 113
MTSESNRTERPPIKIVTFEEQVDVRRQSLYKLKDTQFMKNKIVEYFHKCDEIEKSLTNIDFSKNGYSIRSDARAGIYSSFAACYKGFAPIHPVKGMKAADRRIMEFAVDIIEKFTKSEEVTINFVLQHWSFLRSIFGSEEKGFCEFDHPIECYWAVLVNFFEVDLDNGICKKRPTPLYKKFNKNLGPNKLEDIEKTISEIVRNNFFTYGAGKPGSVEEFEILKLKLRIVGNSSTDESAFVSGCLIGCSAYDAERILELLIYPEVFQHMFKPLAVNRKEAEQNPKTTKTYVIHNPATNLYKIGKSNNPKRRISEIRTMAGVDLATVMIINSDVEYKLHNEFRSLRDVGEWFRLDEEHINNIKDTFSKELI